MARFQLPGTGPDSPLARLVGRVTGGRLTPSATRVATLAAAVVIALGLVALVAFVQVSSTPQFCGTCHIMKPYYASWKTSSHNRIACVECHINPGVTAEIRKKYEAMSMVVKYLTHTYGSKPWAEVDDIACLRCHDRRLLQGKVDFEGVIFDHTPHLTEQRRGMKLRCTSCHGQLVQGQHLTVTVSTCAMCHFQGQPANAGLGRCRNCHEVPERVVTSGGGPFDHRVVGELDMDCSSCHAAVVRGDGRVPRERCLSCHNQADRLAQFGNRDLLHRAHVTEHKVDCTECHLAIEHGKSAPEATVAQDPGSCGPCHGGGHTPQADLYAGRGARGVPSTPSAMYSAGVTCEGCHDPRYSAAPAAGPLGVHTVRANAVSCMACHGPGYEPIFESWKQGVDTRTAALRGQLDATVGAMGISPPRAFEDARRNYLLVEQGRGVHNVNYAYLVLDKAHDQMNEARRQKGLAPLPKPWRVVAPGSGNCLSCHLGIEKQAGAWEGRAFDHGPHLVGAGLECDACHRPHAERAPGEVVRFGAQGCVTCHHRSATEASVATCAGCHGDVSKKTVRSPRGEFSHAAHREIGLECRNCHTLAGGDVRPASKVCAECHVN